MSTMCLHPVPLLCSLLPLSHPPRISILAISLHGENFFDKALANGNLEGGDDVPYVNGIDTAAAAASSALDAWAEEEVQDEVDAGEGGCELDADGEGSEEKELDEVEVPVEEEDSGPGATPGVSETGL